MLLIKNAHIRPMAGEDIANGEILIDGGKIAGIGKHDELLEQKGRYYQLYTGMQELS